MDERTETRRLGRPATEHEMAEAGKRLAGLLARYDQLGRDKKEAVESWNDQLKACDGEISSTRQTIDGGRVEEDVEVRLTFDFDRNAVTVVRADNNLLIEERAMTAAERQEREQIDLPTLQASGSPGTTDGRAAAAGDDADPLFTSEHKGSIIEDGLGKCDDLTCGCHS